MPALAGLRSALYVNDAHPVLDLVRDIMADATANEQLFNTLFHIAELPEFKDSVGLVSDMAKDGTSRSWRTRLSLFFINSRKAEKPLSTTRPSPRSYLSDGTISLLLPLASLWRV